MLKRNYYLNREDIRVRLPLDDDDTPFEKLNDDTELVFVIDASGSMSDLIADTIGGFNSLIAKQKNGNGKVYVTTVIFNSTSTIIHDRVPIENIKEMTREDYVPSGTTALLDALGGTIRHVSNIHKYARPEDVPGNTVFFITTDGMENASKEYSSSEVKRMIESKTNKRGWEFVFVAANIDAINTAERFGIRRERASNYVADCDGVLHCYRAMNEFVTMKRENRMTEHNEEWKSCLED